MILGMTFLEMTNPPINWRSKEFYGNVTIATDDADQWTSERQLQHRRELNPKMYETETNDPTFIPNNERGIIHYPNKYLRKTTTATELAVQAADKTQRTWQEQVPKYYHNFGKVFSEIQSQCFPQSRPWDHAIDLVKDRPEALPGHIIPLAPKEQDALDKIPKGTLK